MAYTSPARIIATAKVMSVKFLSLVAGAVLLLFFVVAVQHARPQPPTPMPATQPKITWSPQAIDLTLSPGEAVTQHVTVTSNVELQDVTIEPVPELATFLNIYPNTLALMPAGQSQPVELTFNLATDASLGTYEGTIHLRQRNRTHPQTLKAHLNVWKQFFISDLQVELKLPPDFNLHRAQSARAEFKNDDTEGYQITFISLTKPASIPLDNWVLRDWLGDEMSDSLNSSPLLRLSEGLDERRDVVVNGMDAIILIFSPIGAEVTAFISDPESDMVYILKFVGDNLDQAEALYSNLNEILTIINTLRVR